MRPPAPTSKGGVLLLALPACLLLVLSGSRTWVTGTVDDAVLGSSRVTGTGGDVASGVVALALAGAAAALASTTSGRVTRRVTVVLMALAALGAAVLVARVLLDASAVLGSLAARSTGRTGTVETHATVTAWPWLALAAAVALVGASVSAWVGARTWQGLSARYDPPAPGGAEGHQDGPAPPARGPRGERVASDWDRLSAGQDPTSGDESTEP
jgi:uncharacterized membrane protein (TIGR02234 family)